MEKLDLIYDLLSEVRSEQRIHGTSIINIQNCMEKNTDELAEHIRRTDLLEQTCEHYNKRLEKIEEPIKVSKGVARWTLGIGALAASILGIIKLVLLVMAVL